MAACDNPLIGMLRWDGNSLSQLEALRGNSTNPDTFDFPILYAKVPGANFETVVRRPDRDVLKASIMAARDLASRGVKAITTSCGFNAIFQKELAEAVSVPVFASSLLQVPMVSRMLRSDQAVGILTADVGSLTIELLEKVGIGGDISLRVAGIGDTGEFSKVLNDTSAKLDGALFVKEVLVCAVDLAARHPEIGAWVLECTDLPPASNMIRKTTGLPVFDIVTLVNFVYEAVAGSPAL